MSNKIWYLPGPFHQYLEDVKALAKDAGLRIIDANATEGREDAASEVPEVTLRETPHQVVIVGAGDSEQLKDLIERLNIERDLIVTLVESAEGLAPLTHPEAGELPIRLFDALSGIHQGITKLKSERDGLATENEALRGEVASLKALANKTADDSAEIEALKAALDAANVTYRVNASKEALQKQVAELTKA